MKHHGWLWYIGSGAEGGRSRYRSSGRIDRAQQAVGRKPQAANEKDGARDKKRKRKRRTTYYYIQEAESTGSLADVGMSDAILKPAIVGQGDEQPGNRVVEQRHP